MLRCDLRAAAALAGVAFLFAASSSGSGQALATHSSSTIGLLAIDANVEGNSPTSLGPIEGCARAEAGSEITVDYVVDAVPQDRPMIGYEAQIRYDAEMLEAVALEHNFLLAASGDYSPFAGLSDDLPDNDGSFRILVLDTASSTEPQANVEAGAGVLARITFRVKEAGRTDVAIAAETDPLVYPLVQDTQNEMILVDRLGSATIAAGEDCPDPPEGPEIEDLAPLNEQILAENPDLVPEGTTGGQDSEGEPGGADSEEAADGAEGAPASSAVNAGSAESSSAGGDGTDTGLIVAAGLLAAAVAAGGGWVLYRRLNSG